MTDTNKAQMYITLAESIGLKPSEVIGGKTLEFWKDINNLYLKHDLTTS